MVYIVEIEYDLIKILHDVDCFSNHVTKQIEHVLKNNIAHIEFILVDVGVIHQ